MMVGVGEVHTRKENTTEKINKIRFNILHKGLYHKPILHYFYTDCTQHDTKLKKYGIM